MQANYIGLCPLTKARVYEIGECKVLVGVEDGGIHMSISHPTRYPTWDEQKEARYQLCPPNITMASYMPPLAKFVNIHPNCFHWWEVGGES